MVDKQIVLERIEKAAGSKATELDLTGLKFDKLPTQIGQLVWLEKLDLEEVGLKTLPKEIGLLRNLKELNLFANQLIELPREIGKLTSLEHLALDINEMRELPLEFSNLINLRKLSFDDNNFGYFPFAITKLTNLETLHIIGNQIEYLPAEIGNLARLEELDINANMLSSLPVQIENLIRLRILDISRNEFSELPDSIFNLENLEELYAGENYIKTISSEISRLSKLKILRLGDSGTGLRYWSPGADYGNELSELPVQLLSLNNLEILELSGNPLPISPEILIFTNDPSKILNSYFKDKSRQTNKRKTHVFLCHSSNDKQQVRKLNKRLVADNIETWLDEEKLLPGQDWEYEISKAIASSDAIVVCLSKNSVSKEGFVQKEIRFALDKAEEKPEGTIFIIPALLENCEVPQRLSRRHWVKLFEKNGYNLLMKALAVRAANLGLN